MSTAVNRSRTTEPSDLNEPGLRAHAVSAAQGKAAFDLLIRGGTVVDMVTGQLRRADVGVVGSLIASVHLPGAFDTAEKIIDASNSFISPGLIDTHLHIESSMLTPAAYSCEVLPRGVTTVVWDPHEYANTCGETGMAFALDCTEQTPLRILTLAPSSVPSAPGYERTGADFTPELVARLLADPRIHGVGEMMSMQAVIEGDPRFAGIAQSGLNASKRVCGHARGLQGSMLNAYVTAGIETDHELTSAEDLETKLQAGLTIELRGSHDHLLPEFVEKLNSLGFLPQTLTLCTDDVFVDDLLERGGLDDVLRRLVGYGLSGVSALQAATLNAAVRIGRNDLGLIAPGKRADIVLFEDLESFCALNTIVNGVSVAEDAQMLVAVPEVDPPADMFHTMKTDTYSADDFLVRTDEAQTEVEAVVIDRPRFTQWGQRILPVQNGRLRCPDDLVRMSIINRFGEDTTPCIAYLGSWGEWRGAFATTVSHDSHNLNIFGGNEEDMAAVANRVISMGGGMAVAINGRIVAALALPVAGLVSLAPAAEIAADFRQVRNAMDRVVKWQPPYLVFKACFGASLVCNPGPRLSDVGIVDPGLGFKQVGPIGRPPVGSLSM